jgi:hypothetical protein
MSVLGRCHLVGNGAVTAFIACEIRHSCLKVKDVLVHILTRRGLKVESTSDRIGEISQ